MMETMKRQAERSEATRAELVREARALFATHGFADTPIELVADRAGVTKGALYHHFRNKRDLFQAVFETIEREVVADAAASSSPDADSWTNLRAGFSCFLDRCLQPDVQRIILLDGPAVLGRETWRRIEEEHALAVITAGLRTTRRDGFLGEQAIEPLAHLLLAAVNEAGLLIAQATDRAATRHEVGAAFDALLTGLRTDVNAG
jgi:AcrR family transcriptional regulator